MYLTPRVALLALIPLLVQAPQTPAPRDPRAGAPALPAGTASLKGVVSIVTSGPPTPLRRAKVLVQADAGALETLDTDVNGRFLVEHLRAGSYHVIVDKPGFVPIGHAPAIDIKDGQAATTTIAMQRGAAIEGRVLTEEGEPAMGLNVSAMRLGFGPYGKKTVAIRQTTTDDLGRFRLNTLLPGEYYVEAAPDPLRMINGPDAAGRAQPARTYYPGTARLNDARIVAVSAGEELTAIDFQAGGAVLATVSARITTSSGKPPASYSIRVQRVGAPAGEVRCFLGGPGGQNDAGFQCSSVPPGDFRFLVAARPAPDADVEYGIAQVTVDGRNMLNIPIATVVGSPLTGHVEVEGGSALPAAAQIVPLETEYEFPAPAIGATVNSATPPQPISPDGNFTFPSLAGSRLLRAVLPEGWALKGVWLGDTEISDTPLVFAAGDKPRAVRVVITPRTGSVAGAVLAAANQSAAGTRVVVFSEDHSRWGARSRFIRTVEVNAAGRYAISGLLPGKYIVAAVDALDDGAWEDPDVLLRLQSNATPIVITGTEHLAIDVRLR